MISFICSPPSVIPFYYTRGALKKKDDNSYFFHIFETNPRPRVKRKTPSERKEFIKRDSFRSDGRSLVQLLGQAGLFPVGGILMNNALRGRFVNNGGSRGQLLIGVGRVGGYSSIELANGSTHTALHNTIPQILLLTDLDALFRGLDIRQLGSPPLRILKKPSHGMISCLIRNCNPFPK